jgi:hypothetical protein
LAGSPSLTLSLSAIAALNPALRRHLSFKNSRFRSFYTV